MELLAQSAHLVQEIRTLRNKLHVTVAQSKALLDIYANEKAQTEIRDVPVKAAKK